LRSLVTDLQLVDGARGIISLFSARHPSETGGIPTPIFPEELPQGREYEELVHCVMSNELIRGKRLSSDGSLAAIVLSLDPAVIESGKLNKVIDDIRSTTSEDLLAMMFRRLTWSWICRNKHPGRNCVRRKFSAQEATDCACCARDCGQIGICRLGLAPRDRSNYSARCS